MPSRHSIVRARHRAAATFAAILFALQPVAAEASATAGPSEPPAATLDLAREQRVATLGYRLARAAVSMCDPVESMTGMGLHDIASYAERLRPTIHNAYHMDDGFGVRFVVPGGAADRAGVQAGDEIVALDGAALNGFATDLIGHDASPDRTERFAATLRDTLAQHPALLLVRHDAAIVPRRLSGDRGCGGRFVVAPGGALNAWSDGAGVAITARLVDFVKSDDELAFVIGHEMSHNILHHADRTKGRSPLLANFGIGAGVIKATEIEADALAVKLMLRAGFDPVGGELFLRRLGHARGPSFAFTHPTTERRIALLRAAVLAAQNPDDSDKRRQQ